MRAGLPEVFQRILKFSILEYCEMKMRARGPSGISALCYELSRKNMLANMHQYF
jgi:hypothetical protein